ncbi:unnamed protein product [Cyclocybe aegerita]|uniref:Uncharacterized protein n=1 Tax=Cyclocybe aegerita TaxID=1973307 RepID=A0A8S0WUY8_CYCAE|nr:unnamed protein product [Cyclocybe aegerita]
MVHELFNQALARHYEAVKNQYPGEGRRKTRLRVLYHSWPGIALPRGSGDVPKTAPPALTEIDPNPLDQTLEDDELGLIIRTDFTNEAAWKTFCAKVEVTQKDLISDLAGGAPADDVPMEEGASSQADGTESDSSTEVPDMIKILDPQEQSDRARLTNISNLTALRLFNEVDIRPTPPPPAGSKKISPPNPLVDRAGWQEIYTGKTLWIYDSRSNADECARLVSQTGDFYGTATGDSWRARASHICELQFNLSQGMKIDFNGQDRWDWNERARNLEEATTI